MFINRDAGISKAARAGRMPLAEPRQAAFLPKEIR
jgi:hypothetical protein